MEFETEKQGQFIIVKPKVKEIDALNALIFKSRLMDIIEKETKIALDLSEIDFIDSSGLSVFISIFKSLGGIKEDFVLYGLKPIVVDIFKYTGVTKVWNVFENKEQALTSISRSS